MKHTEMSVIVIIKLLQIFCNAGEGRQHKLLVPSKSLLFVLLGSCGENDVTGLCICACKPRIIVDIENYFVYVKRKYIDHTRHYVFKKNL